MPKLFVVYDVKSETYTPPTMQQATGQAIRSFADAVNGDKGDISHHPQDYTLFEIGEYSIETGEVSLYDTKKSLANGLDLKQEAVA